MCITCMCVYVYVWSCRQENPLPWTLSSCVAKCCNFPLSSQLFKVSLQISHRLGKQITNSYSHMNWIIDFIDVRMGNYKQVFALVGKMEPPWEEGKRRHTFRWKTLVSWHLELREFYTYPSYLHPQLSPPPPLFDCRILPLSVHKNKTYTACWNLNSLKSSASCWQEFSDPPVGLIRGCC